MSTNRNHRSPPPPHRSHAPPSALSALSLLYKTLTDAIQDLIASLHPNTNSNSTDVLSALDQLILRLDEFERLTERADPEGGELDGLGRWKDECDAMGTQLWNMSTVRKYNATAQSGQDGAKQELIIAKLRLVAFLLINLGVVDLSESVRASLLSLATKAALAFMQLPTTPDLKTALTLVKRAVDFAESLPTPVALAYAELPSSEVTKALVGYFCCRALLGTLQENDSLVTWVHTRTKELVSSGALARRELDKLAQTMHDSGKIMLGQAREHRKQAQQAAEDEEDERVKADKKNKADERIESAKHWLTEAVELLEQLEGAVQGGTRQLQCSALRLLVQAELESDPADKLKAELTLSRFLEVDPSVPAMHRRYIRLLTERPSHTDAELIDAFAHAVAAVPWKQQECALLMSEVYHIALSRAELKFAILDVLVDGVAARLDEMRTERAPPAHLVDPDTDLGYGPMLFVASLVQTTMFGLASSQLVQLKSLLDKIDNVIHGQFDLAENAAYVLATYAWKEGDKATKEANPRQAVDWYLLAAHPITSSIKAVVWPKAHRKAGLALTELKLYAEAEQVLSVAREDGAQPDARTEFVRFNNFTQARQFAEAKQALRSMVAGAQFEVNMLLWSSDIAQKADSLELQNAVLHELLELCKAKSTVKVDSAVLVRCLIRTTYSRIETGAKELEDKRLDLEDRKKKVKNQVDLGRILFEYLRVGLNLATNAHRDDSANKDEHTLVQNIRWLYSIGHAFAAKCEPEEWPDDLISSLYSTVASLMALHIAIKPTDEGEAELEIKSRVWLCRFGAITDKVRKVRQAEPGTKEEKAAWSNLLEPLHKLRSALAASRREDPTIDKVDDLQAALIGMEVEGNVAVPDWMKINALLSSFATDHPTLGPDVLKMTALVALEHPSAPPEYTTTILQNVFHTLNSMKGIKIVELATWLRLLITHLLNRGLNKDALDFARIAVAKIKRDPVGYTEDEVSWVATTCFKRGQALLKIDSNSEVAIDWCYAGASAGKKANLAWANDLNPDGDDDGQGNAGGEVEQVAQDAGQGEQPMIE